MAPPEPAATGSDPRITPPFGYDAVVPLQRDHRVRLLQGAAPQFCRTVNALALSRSEFIAAHRDYPVVFVTPDEGASFAPVAVLGLANGENLFIDAAGHWDPAAYRPAYLRRFPFCVANVVVADEAQADAVVCVAAASIDAQGAALFENDDRPTAYWQSMQQLLAQYEADLRETEAMCTAFAKLELFAPFHFQVVIDEQPGLKLDGMYRIDEKKFTDLRPASHKALVSKGLMSPIFAHLHSLENFGRLYDRAVARARAAVPA